MIISHKYKFVCLNPPKTGSGFRENTLKECADVSRSTHKPLKLRHWSSCQASNYIKSINKDPNDYYWFTFVRNPWERMVSWVNMIQNHALESGNSENIDREKSILQYPIRNQFKDYIYRDGKLLDFIGSLENITEDMKFILKKLNINIKVDSFQAKYKKDFKDEIRDNMSRKTIEIISNLEKEVIEMKNYKFGE
jgi:hypothetical protein